MVNVFEDQKFAVKYEQTNLDAGNIYGKFADTTINLMGIINGSMILDLGCGTGISTSKLFDSNTSLFVVGVDKSKPFLDIARLKFGQADNLDFYLRLIRNDHPYPYMIREQCDIKDLETHLKREVDKYQGFKDKVVLHQLDASDIRSVSDEPFDYVLASQIIHWFRKRDARPEQPNLEYEREVLQAVRDKLKQDGLFGFNTPGWSFRFEDNAMNEKHLSNHPFYLAFMESIKTQLGDKAVQEKKFDHKEIERIAIENGFEIKTVDQRGIRYNPKMLLEVCLIGGHMQIFQKANVESTIEEREEMLNKAVVYALSKSSPEEKPVIETGAHYILRRI